MPPQPRKSIRETGRAVVDFRGRARRPATAGYLPLLGAAKNVSVAYAPVTNEDYAKFTGKPAAEV